jgi:peptidyl-prolyl isomerase H (cyclophilin H)
MNDKHVVFGYLLGGDSFKTLSKIEEAGSASGEPVKPVVISECGQLFP